jgi:hypothetical protein
MRSPIAWVPVNPEGEMSENGQTPSALTGEVGAITGQPAVPQQGTQAAPGKTFTQEELDRIIAARLQREREKFRDYDALRRKAEEFDKLQQAQMSEQERLAKRLAELEQENQTLRQQGQEHTLKYEIMLLASRMGIVDPEAAYRLLDLFQSPPCLSAECNAICVRASAGVRMVSIPTLPFSRVQHDLP